MQAITLSPAAGCRTSGCSCSRPCSRLVTGFLFVRNPGVAVGTLALLMVIFFMVEGIAKIVLALTVRPLANWGLVLLSGLIGVALSLYLIANPALSLLVLGLFIGIQLISEGIAICMLAWTVRKA